MSNFKIKKNKTKHITDIKTLDDDHTNVINCYEAEQDNIDNLKNELNECKIKLDKYNKKDPSELREKDRMRMLELKENIESLNKQIELIDEKVDILNYYHVFADVVSKYYDFDGKNNTTTNVSSSSNKPKQKKEKDIFDNNADDILDKLNETTKSNKKIKKPIKKRNVVNTGAKTTIFDNLGSTVKIDKVIDKAYLHNEYLRVLRNDRVKSNKISHCSNPNCKSTKEKIIISMEGIMICPDCKWTSDMIIDNETQNIKEGNTDKPKYPYKKSNHFAEKIRQFLSRETTSIPKEIYETIDIEMRKRLMKPSDVTLKFVKNTLKTYQFNKYYEHYHSIYCKVANKPPFSLTRDEEEDLFKKFKMIEKAYYKHKPEKRSNFLNYYYVINKLMINQGKYEFAECFPLLKRREKLREQDVVWEKICNEYGWKFVSSDTFSINYYSVNSENNDDSDISISSSDSE